MSSLLAGRVQAGVWVARDHVQEKQKNLQTKLKPNSGHPLGFQVAVGFQESSKGIKPGFPRLHRHGIFQDYIDMVYGRLERRVGPLAEWSQHGPEEVRHWFPRLDFLLSAALSRNDKVPHCGIALSANPSSGSDYDIFSAPVDMASLAVHQEHV